MSNYFRLVELDGMQTAAFIADGRAHSVDQSNPRFDDIVDALRDGDYGEAARLVDIKTGIVESFSRVSDRVSLAGNTLYFDGEPVDNQLSRTIVQAYGEGREFGPLVNFLEKLYVNTNAYVREQLFNWLDDRSFTVLPDGDFVAYKGVYNTNGEFKSVHSGQATVNGQVRNGQIPQKVGDVVEMPRGSVNANPEQGCSTGLHAGTFSYAATYGDTVLTVKINPRDVVSVPNDSSFQKLRVCRYTVLAVSPSPVATVFHPSTWDYDDATEDDDWDGEDFEEQVVATFKSSSNPNIEYEVVECADGTLDCTCPGFHYRGDCKHLRLVA